MIRRIRLGAAVTMLALAAGAAFANGGPFVVKYPGGDPAAKGILARLDPDLKPRKETKLRVTKEDLNVAFGAEPFGATDGAPPVVNVSAIYTIANPTTEDIEADFGFPILRGIYLSPFGMMPVPDVSVTLGDARMAATIISNSAIYGIVRQRAHDTIDQALTADAHLGTLVAAVRGATETEREQPEAALRQYLKGTKKWNERDAALMVDYASLDLNRPGPVPVFAPGVFPADKDLRLLPSSNLGPLGAIGDQKATQFFAQLASRFDRKAASTYESIFSAWGGDVRQRSVDMTSGLVRPREFTADSKPPSRFADAGDPTVYARVDYLDTTKNITEAERACCRDILKNLPVVFTFAPMNLLHYQVKFPAGSTQTLTVRYRQHAYEDTRSPRTYQISYVVYPASLWSEFGPIDLEVTAPDGVGFRASTPCKDCGLEQKQSTGERATADLYTKGLTSRTYRTTLKNKTDELFLAVDAESWKKATTRNLPPAPSISGVPAAKPIVRPAPAQKPPSTPAAQSAK